VRRLPGKGLVALTICMSEEEATRLLERVRQLQTRQRTHRQTRHPSMSGIVRLAVAQLFARAIEDVEQLMVADEAVIARSGRRGAGPRPRTRRPRPDPASERPPDPPGRAAADAIAAVRRVLERADHPPTAAAPGRLPVPRATFRF